MYIYIYMHMIVSQNSRYEFGPHEKDNGVYFGVHQFCEATTYTDPCLITNLAFKLYSKREVSCPNPES